MCFEVAVVGCRGMFVGLHTFGMRCQMCDRASTYTQHHHSGEWCARVRIFSDANVDLNLLKLCTVQNANDGSPERRNAFTTTDTLWQLSLIALCAPNEKYISNKQLDETKLEPNRNIENYQSILYLDRTKTKKRRCDAARYTNVDLDWFALDSTLWTHIRCKQIEISECVNFHDKINSVKSKLTNILN